MCFFWLLVRKPSVASRGRRAAHVKSHVCLSLVDVALPAAPCHATPNLALPCHAALAAPHLACLASPLLRITSAQPIAQVCRTRKGEARAIPSPENDAG